MYDPTQFGTLGSGFDSQTVSRKEFSYLSMSTQDSEIRVMTTRQQVKIMYLRSCTYVPVDFLQFGKKASTKYG